VAPWPGSTKGKIVPRPELRPRPRATVPTAIAGTIALSLTATPALAAGGSPSESGLALPGAVPVPAGLRHAATVAAAPTEVSPATYTVRSGDTVSAIATAHGMRTADVLAWNGLDWASVIRPGDVLRLAPDPAPSVAAVTTGAVHTVVAGDTLWRIASERGVSLDALFAANSLTDASIIYPGQTLTIPGVSAAPAPTVAATVPETETIAESAPGASLDEEQVANARIIIAVGRTLGVPDRGIAIALATAMVESWVRNLDWGDRDSLGLFQQRPTMGWGTDEQVRDPYRAAAAFFGGPGDPNGTRTRGLLDIPGWETMDFGAVAQEVQRSAYPDRYAPWEEQAHAWLATLG